MPDRRRNANEVKPCGTKAAYQRHLHRGEMPCQACIEARNRAYPEDNRRRRELKERGIKRELKPCGTAAAYQRHLLHGEDPCQACLQATVAKRRAKGVKAREIKPCGTKAGYQRHLYRGEPPCKECIEASTIARRKDYKTLSPERWESLGQKRADASRKHHLWKKYRITVADFDRLFALQGQRCACCKSTDPKFKYGYLTAYKERGGYLNTSPEPPKPPRKYFSKKATICFEMLEQGKTVDEIIVELRVQPEVVLNLHKKWLQGRWDGTKKLRQTNPRQDRRRVRGRKLQPAGTVNTDD